MIIIINIMESSIIKKKNIGKKTDLKSLHCCLRMTQEFPSELSTTECLFLPDAIAVAAAMPAGPVAKR